MGKFSNSGMGPGQNMFSVGHIPKVSGYKRRKPLKSQRSKLRALKLYAAEHGLFLKVGPLLYKMDNPAGFFNRLDAAASEQETGGFARKFIHQMHASLGRERLFVKKGFARKPLWVSVKQKEAIFRREK